ncbi:unnamed protein product (macronuclear) [Paramecium tetraurelia]|uniref:Uncharacterized protein n=1 Tax=Paramecium tetraurelia TaxID=5888 RepID=A0DIW5_PARTE|nr:uncharacterized protein GSPATT00017339001 [Paramecium tetraurelia]CAK82982.1 unnamed protein product [Paramecium tetraurelia]|eukprot:XP_001450379.1 hypothetical protein (macronuclear) [Paramecium tetraurelia strain d4-2]
MLAKHSRLFESGAEPIKREILESYLVQTKKHNSNEDSQLREQIEKLTNEVATIKKSVSTKQNDKAIQCVDRNYELMNSLLKQKDKSIEQYERQILSFKNMILQIDHQKKKLLNKLEGQDPMKNSQATLLSQQNQILFDKQMICKSQQTEIEFGINFSQNCVNSSVITQKSNSQSVQTDSKFYNEINMLTQDEVRKEIEQYKVILKEYDLENRKMKKQIKQLQNSKSQIDQDTQTGLIQLDKAVQLEDDLKRELEQTIKEHQQCIDVLNSTKKQFNQQTMELTILKNQYDSLLSDYYFIQSENKSNEKIINQLNEEIEQLKLGIQTKEFSISSADTLTSPNDSLRSYKKMGSNLKLNIVNPTYFNPQSIDELILAQQENQILVLKISELKYQLLELQRNQKNLLEEMNQRDDLMNSQQQELQKYRNDCKEFERRMENVKKLEAKLMEKENWYVVEISGLQQDMTALKQEYAGLKIINQTLHKQLEKYQNRGLLQHSK